MSPALAMDQDYLRIAPFDETAENVAGISSSFKALRQSKIGPASIANSWIKIAREQLAAIQELPTGWDSHGAQPPAVETVAGAYDLLLCLAQAAKLPKPHVNPTPSGGVQFEWENANRYFEVEVTSPGEARYFFQDPGAGEEAEGMVRQGGSLTPVLTHVARTFCA